MTFLVYFFGGGGLEGLGGTGFPDFCRGGSGDRPGLTSEGCGLAEERLGLLVEWAWFLGRDGRGGTGRGGGGRDTVEEELDDASGSLGGVWFSGRGGRCLRGGAMGEGPSSRPSALLIAAASPFSRLFSEEEVKWVWSSSSVDCFAESRFFSSSSASAPWPDSSPSMLHGDTPTIT